MNTTKDIYSIINQIVTSPANHTYDQDNKTITIEQINEYHSDLLKSHSDIIEHINQNTITIDIKKLNNESTNVFYDEDDFLTSSQRIANTKNKTFRIVIIKTSSNELFIEDFKNGSPTTTSHSNNHLIENAIVYWETLSFFRTNDKLVTFIDKAKSELIFFSPSMGKAVIEFSRNTPPHSKTPLKIHLEKLRTKLEQPNYKVIFINEIVNTFQNKPTPNKLEHLITNIETLTNTSDKNYDLYISGFSFNELITEFHTKKKEFITDIRESAEKLHNQITATPISFSAMTFALYKIKDDPYLLAVVSLGNLFISILMLASIFSAHESVENIEKGIFEDFETLKSRSPISIIDLEETESFLNRRTFITKALMETYSIFICLFIAATFLYVVQNI